MSMKFAYPRLPLNDTVEIFSKKVQITQLPKNLKLMEDEGIAGAQCLESALLYRSVKNLYEVRGTITPSGDYLAMFPVGEHFSGFEKKANTMIALRSKDRGKTWSAPYLPFKNIDYNQHAFVPYIPKRSKRIYSYGTQPVWGLYSRKRSRENAPVGYMFSDDDGYNWKGPELIFPVNAPEFLGISVMRLCETNRGTLLFSSSDNITDCKPYIVSQYILRSEDKGKSWRVIPEYKGFGSGWNFRPQCFMGEGTPFQIGEKILMLERAPEGHLWIMYSNDDGKTWTAPEPTSLVHPDAPPMSIVLSDNKTLLCLHHNRGHLAVNNGTDWNQRSEIWVSFSQDCGKTWSEPAFLFCNAAKPEGDNAFNNFQCSYIDMFIDSGVLNLFVPHLWRQVLHLQIKEKDLYNLPKKLELGV